MSRFDRFVCFEMFALLAIRFMLSAPAMSQSSLETVREIYQQYTPQNFDDGGEFSHYVWKNFASLLRL